MRAGLVQTRTAELGSRLGDMGRGSPPGLAARARKSSRADSFGTASWADGLRFLAGYAEHWHDAREEAVFDLFPPFHVASETVRALRAEHIQARGLVHELRAAVGARDARSIELAADLLTRLLRRHILIEEDLFQRIVRREIADEQLARAMADAVPAEAAIRARALEELAEHVVASASTSQAG
ncbi:MAG: hemerythrin domain-containing protein [Planctomycetota bacterium]